MGVLASMYKPTFMRPRRPRDADDVPGMNDKRAGWAESALDAFIATGAGEKPWPGITREDKKALLAQNLGDMLADLGHFADRKGLKLSELIAKAGRMYAEETGGKGIQFGPSDPIDRMYAEAFANPTENESAKQG
jgi:hypothetical protein